MKRTTSVRRRIEQMEAACASIPTGAELVAAIEQAIDELVADLRTRGQGIESLGLDVADKVDAALDAEIRARLEGDR